MAEEPHPQAQTVLETIESQPVPPTHAVTVTEAREQFERMATMQDGETVADVRNFEIPGPAEPLDVRAYYPDRDGPHPIAVFFHGGGFVIGSPDTHDGFARGLANAAGCIVLSVDYRLAPEHPFPAAVEDAYAALEWAADHGEHIDADPERLAVVGDSAGGNLATVASLLARDRGGPTVAHQVLCYPVVSSPVLEAFDSYSENAEGYFLETETMQWFLERYAPDPSVYRNAYFAPLLARDLSDLPPATVVTAGFDPLRDEGEAYAERLSDVGVAVDHYAYDDMIHGFASMTGFVDAAEDVVERIGTSLAESF